MAKSNMVIDGSLNSKITDVLLGQAAGRRDRTRVYQLQDHRSGAQQAFHWVDPRG